jgi:hypothetical protein
MIEAVLVVALIFSLMVLFAVAQPHLGGKFTCTFCGKDVGFDGGQKWAQCSGCGHRTRVRMFGKD